MPRKSKAPAGTLAKLPAGFKELGGGNSWKGHEIGDMLTGTYLGFTVVHQPKKGKIPARDVNKHEIVDDDGVIHAVWQSAGLKALEGLKKKQKVLIQFLGEMVIMKGQSPMRKYRVAVK
jgi:hypothetical protein